ncbi:MAG: beta-lactamase family protein [Dehalococcoidia bacterium]|nr:beta-lactamase family protein [Dehalococcoidia bacterium]
MTTTVSALSEKVRALLLDQIQRGTQLGTQVCAYRNGEMIVDAWAGEIGPEDSRPVQADTLFPSFSTTKGVAATALHILADRGVIDYAAPVSEYWPEFAVNGKERITVAQAMSHQSGLHAAPPNEVALNWDRAIDFIASGTPAYEPGTSTGYHAITYAWVVGGIVQGASGRHIKDVIQEEIAGPLGIQGEMYVGIPDGVEDRLAWLQSPPEPTPEQAAMNPMANLPDDHDFFKAMPRTGALDWNSMEVRKACIPSANGHFTARALARMYAALAHGGEVGGVRLVSPERIAQMSRVQVDTPDRVIFMPIRKSIGFFNGGKTMGMHGATGPRETAFGHPGAGGSIAFADPDVNLSIAVTINKMQGTLQAEGPTFEICELIRKELGVNA